MDNKKEPSCLSYYKKIRGNWNGINPVTKVYKDKTKYSRKEKHKKDYTKE